jgi:hypothetical protein
MCCGRRPPLDCCRGGVSPQSQTTNGATRDQLNMASIDGQDLTERMFDPAPILTRVFGE